MRSIIILGAGNIGSRHLQGLSDLEFSSHIHVVDPDSKSLFLSQKRWDDLDCNRHVISYHSSIKEINKKEVSVAIIATPSSVRRDVFEDLIEHCDVESIIFEKFLFQVERDYHEVASSLRRNGINAWVNHPRRYFQIYKNIEDSIDNEPVNVSVSGTQWGLGCNAIHYADLFGWLTGSKELIWDNSSLENRLLEAKRNNFVEFAGTLSANDTAGNILSLTCFEGQEPYKTVRISTPTQQWIINPLEQEGVHITREKGEWVSKNIPAEIPYVSELTGEIVGEIIQNKTSDLPTYSKSKAYHLPLFRILRQHIGMIWGKEVEKCPIT